MIRIDSPNRGIAGRRANVEQGGEGRRRGRDGRTHASITKRQNLIRETVVRQLGEDRIVSALSQPSPLSVRE